MGAAQKSSEKSFKKKATDLLKVREMGVLVALIILMMIMTFASPFFLNTRNIFNVLRGMSTIGIMGIGVTMVIVTGGIDLSVGSLMAVTGVVTARVMFMGGHPVLAVIAGFGTGLLLGTVNGLVITKLRVTPFIATLGMLSIGRGMTYFFATGVRGTVASNIPMRNEAVNFLGAGYIGLVPMPVIVLGVLVVFFTFFLKNTVLGRQIYAVGSNEEASRLSGVNVKRSQVFVYSITGVLCALAGIINSGIISTAATNAGMGTELDVIAAVVIGGASLTGGMGTVIGAIIGAAIMAVLRNAFVLLRLPGFVQTISIGVVIILAVALDNLRKHPAK